jgi:hypothetical protein
MPEQKRVPFIGLNPAVCEHGFATRVCSPIPVRGGSKMTKGRVHLRSVP